MKQRTEYRIGPGMTSLLMIFMVLCLATLAILAYASVRADSTLTRRNVESTTAYYAASAKVQQTLFELDEQLATLRAQAGGAEAYVQQVRSAYALAEGADDVMEIPLEIVERMDEQRILRVRLSIPIVSNGPRYVIQSYQTLNDSAWDAAQGIGYYVPAASDEEEDGAASD